MWVFGTVAYFGSGVILPPMPSFDIVPFDIPFLPIESLPIESLLIESFDIGSLPIAPLFMLFFDMLPEDFPVLVVLLSVPSAEPLLVAEPPLRPPPPPPPPDQPALPAPPAPPAPCARADTEPMAIHEVRSAAVSFFISVVQY